MKTDYLITALVCAVFPVMIPVTLIILAFFCVSAVKKAKRDELGTDS